MTERNKLPARAAEIDGMRPESPGLPALIRDAGGAARFAFEEFFHGQIRNPSTRKAYLHAVRLFSE